MKDFNFYWNTRIHFGKGVLTELTEEILRYGERIFFIYGKTAAQMTGAYDLVHQMCREAGIAVTDFTGIEPNPRHTTIDRGAALLREQGADCIVALGGGSLIDSAKTLSFSVYHEGSCWDFFEGKASAQKALPVIAVPTVAASGAEVSNVAVVYNEQKQQKRDYRTDVMRPAAVFADPVYTYAVPAFQTASGIIDSMSHAFEGYFSSSTGSLQDGISETIQKACIEHGRKALLCPRLYESRAQLLWASELSITHLADNGRSFLAPVHAMEGKLSGYLHLTHGAGIAIVALAWFTYALNDETVSRFARWGRNVWGLPAASDEYRTAREAIGSYKMFLEEIGLPLHLSELKGEFAEEILKRAADDVFHAYPTKDWYHPLQSVEEVLDVLRLAY